MTRIRSERLLSELHVLGHDVDTVRTEHLAGRNDHEVWLAAQSDALVNRVAMLFATELVDQWGGRLVVAAGHKVRVRRPA